MLQDDRGESRPELQYLETRGSKTGDCSARNHPDTQGSRSGQIASCQDNYQALAGEA